MSTEIYRVHKMLSVRIKNKDYSVHGNTLPVLADVDFDVAQGEALVLLGPSGCGKSTLLELICGLQAPQAGRVACAPAVLMLSLIHI